MTQLTLDFKEAVLDARCAPRDPETAESLHEWCMLFKERNGHYADARTQCKALAEHPDWRGATYAQAVRTLRNAIPMRRDRC